MDKLNKKDYRLILVCIIGSIIFCFTTIKYFYKAFPEASIEFNITRKEAKHLAENFLHKMGINVNKYKYANIFSYDNTTKVFLERELGLEEANKIMGKTIRMWLWKNRYFIPLKKEEFIVDITTKGELVGFTHLIEEDKELPYISEDSAKILAKSFIQNEIKIDTAELKFLSVETKKLPKRTDYTFLWKKFDIKDAEYRIKVVIQGNEVGEYKEYLHVPEKWERMYKRLRSLNETAGQFSGMLTLLIIIGLLFTLIIEVRRKNIKWKIASILGIICFILVVLGEINSSPIALFSYETKDSYAGFISRNIFIAILSGLLLGIFIIFLTAAGEPIYRESYKDKVSVSNLFGWRNFRTKSFFIQLIVGFTLSFFFIAYQVIFYILAKKIGAWAPSDIPYSNILSTKIPWIYVLLAGFFPAVSEEFMFRLFSIPFIKKLTKSLFLAIILASFIWGFGHSAYPQQPFYIRGIEVGLVGILASIIMLKFSILPCLVWHYSVNAFYTAFLLLRAKNLYFITSGVLSAGILFIPLIICIIWYIKEKCFYTKEALINELEAAPTIEIKEKIEESHPIHYTKLSYKNKIIATIIGLIFLLSFLIKKEEIGDFIKYKLTKKEIIEKANIYMKEKGIDISNYKCIAYTHSNFDKYGAKYIVDRKGVSFANKIYDKEIGSDFWCVRYFKPLQKEEYRLYIEAKTGNLYNLNHIIAEEKEGAELSKDSALNIANNFLINKKINLEDYELKEIIPNKRKNRLDYSFVWEKDFIDESKIRIKVDIQGDEVSNFSKYIKVPENWERERDKTTIFDTIRVIFMAIVIIFLVINVIFSFKGAKLINWLKIIIISIIPAGLAILDRINTLPIIYKNYDTSIALNIFNTTSTILTVTLIIGVFILAIICLATISVSFPDSIYTFRKENISRLFGDAVFYSIFGLIWFLFVENIQSFILYKFPKCTIIGNLEPIPYIDKSIPFISYLFENVIQTLLTITVLSMIVSSVKRIWSKNKFFIFILGTLTLIGFSGGKTFSEFSVSLLFLGIEMASVFLLIKYLYRNNFVAYPLSYFLFLTFVDLHSLYTKSNYKIDAIALGFIILIIYLIFYSRQKFSKNI